MKRRGAFFPVVMGAAVIAALLAGFWMSDLRRTPPEELVLPPSPSLFNPAPGLSFSPAASGLPDELLQVGPDTVQAALRTLTRPEEYSAEYETTWHYGLSATSRRSDVYARDGLTKIETYDPQGSPDEHYLTDGDRLCFWEDGIAFSAAAMGARNADDPARVPTYEAVLDADPGDIASASYELYDARPFIVVRTRGPVYDTTWWISLETALMHRAELTEKDGSPAVTVSMTDYNINPPGQDRFLLPDGRAFRAWLEELRVE